MAYESATFLKLIQDMKCSTPRRLALHQVNKFMSLRFDWGSFNYVILLRPHLSSAKIKNNNQNATHYRKNKRDSSQN